MSSGWKCTARQYSDQMMCDRCGFAWDMNDPEPPRCKTKDELNHEVGTATLAELREGLDDA